MDIGYIRVSTVDQNTARQLAGIELDRIYEDKASGKSTDRPELHRCLDNMRPGDVLHVHSMDRLARNLADLLNIVQGLAAQGVAVRFEKEGLTFDGKENAASMLMLQIMGAVAQFERALILERQREGIEQAKLAGVYKGRKPTPIADLRRIAKLVDEGKKTAEACREVGVARSVYYAWKAEEKAKAQAQP